MLCSPVFFFIQIVLCYDFLKNVGIFFRLIELKTSWIFPTRHSDVTSILKDLFTFFEENKCLSVLHIYVKPVFKIVIGITKKDCVYHFKNIIMGWGFSCAKPNH